jgi:hypothetical protein
VHPRTLHRRIPFALATAICGAPILIAFATPAGAQDEPVLRSFFEGKHVTVRMDMPATSDGIDVHVSSERPIDFQQYGDRLKAYGTSIPTGASSVVTRVKVKKDLIEFQLGGGGFGTFGDEWNSSVYTPPLLDKSNRERELERKIKDESDSHRRREMERDLDELRESRERENRRIEIRRAEAEERKREQIAQKRLMDGSRFNLRYAASVPSDIRPEDVMAALAPYVDFSPAAPEAPDTGFLNRPAEPGLPPVDTLPRKGMTRAEAERELGNPIDSSERREGVLTVTTLVFARGEQRVTAEFVSDILVRYTVVSR